MAKRRRYLDRSEVENLPVAYLKQSGHYHLATCPYYSLELPQMTKQKAEGLGATPCGVCWPWKVSPANEKPKTQELPASPGHKSGGRRPG